MSNPICVACRNPIQPKQVRLTLSHDAGGGGRHTKGVYAHRLCFEAFERVRDWIAANRESEIQALENAAFHARGDRS